MKYRREIDGLRAVAVLPVILFHAGLPFVPGGYIGVDVFFVISGFLITTILINDLEEKRYSLARFYERRARRILPALFVMMAVTVPLAWIFLIPVEFADYARSFGAAALFISNFHFGEKQGGYFAANIGEKPLLHTWSLGVEEQYYLVIPLLLFLCMMSGRRLTFAILGLIAVASLMLSDWGSRNEPTVNFFFTPSRFWELLAGSLLALYATGRQMKGHDMLAGLGLAMVVAAMLLYTERTPFPSFYTLLPVVGTVLILAFAREGTQVARLLSARVMVGIGLISYSAYLWHHPVYSFARVRYFGDPPVLMMVGLTIGVFGLAWASWRFVEQPFRGKTPALLPKRKQVFVASGAVSLLFLGFGVWGLANGGFPGRVQLAPELQASLTDGYIKSEADPCFNFALFVPDGQPAQDYYCVIGDPDGARTVLVIGDSHVIPYFFELDRQFAEMGVRMLTSVQGGCPPLPDVYLWYRQEIDAGCTRRNAYALTPEAFEGADAVVLAARWSFYVTGDFVTQPAYMDTSPNVLRDRARSAEVFGSQLRELQSRVEDAGARLVLIQQPPYQNHWTEDVYARVALADLDFDEVDAAYAVERAEHDARYAPIREELEDLARSDGTVALSFEDDLCGPVRCSFGTAEFSNYKDHDHLSIRIGAEFAKRIIAAIYPDEQS